MKHWPKFLTIPRAPDFVVGPEAAPYLRRWNFLPRNKWFNIYLHHFMRSDDDRALHDHMYDNISFLVRGRYIEVTKENRIERRPLCPVFRRAEVAHRVELIDGRHVWSIFLMGRRRREWGFHCPQGWRHWTKFVVQRKGGNEMGPGCGE